VEVLGHEDVTVYTEIELLSSFFQDIQKCLFDAVIVEQRTSMITTARDEVGASDIVTALETSGHASRVDEVRTWVGDLRHRRRCCVFSLEQPEMWVPHPFAKRKGGIENGTRPVGWKSP
jgi:hypothetical protein